MALAVDKEGRKPQRRAGAKPRGSAGTQAASKAFVDMSRRWASPSMETLADIREGVRFAALEGLDAIQPGLTHKIIPKSTLAHLRKRFDRLPAEQSDRVYQAGKVLGFALTVFGDEEKARTFLTRRHPMLEDRTPLDVAIESSAGADVVVNLIGRGAYGGGA